MIPTVRVPIVTPSDLEIVDIVRGSSTVSYTHLVKGDIKEASTIFGEASFNVVTSNPPYMKENHGIVNPDSAKAIARHELLCSLCLLYTSRCV